jgi:hypothetical protein
MLQRERQMSEVDHSPPSLDEVTKGGTILPVSLTHSWHVAKGKFYIFLWTKFHYIHYLQGE